nr:PREDICTED: uncharacterized protein LOC105673967 [Linepithema humile]
MPFKCCVPNCNGNYKNGPKVATFSFPKNEEIKRKWLRAICRQNFCPTNSSKVCELHFHSHDIERETSHYNEANGKLLTAPLRHPRLIKNAVPSQLLNNPQYLTKSEAPHRESPEKKRLKMENFLIEQAITSSIESRKTFDEKNGFSTLEELYVKLKDRIDIHKWIISHKDTTIYFFHVEDTSYPNVKCCARVSENFTVTLFYGSREVKYLKKLKFPLVVSNIIEIEDILDQALISLEEEYQDCSVKENLDICIDILNSLSTTLSEQKPVIDFLLQQIKLLDISKKNAFRYSWETTLFCGLVHSISPHAYKFLRNFGHLLLPSSTTIKRICSNFSTNPQLEQDESTFLHYILSKFKLLNAEDKTITLMMDKIHIKPYVDYKGGNIVGRAFNSTECAMSAHVFMINSMLSTYRDVVHILPVKTLQASILHDFIAKIVIGLENIGFEVLAVVSDNNAINKKAMSFFSNPPEISNVYRNPKDSSRPLFYVIDSVHIIKNIRNNWINQKPHQYMQYPDFKEQKMRLASFQSLKDMHSTEKDNLLQYGYTLSLKSLYPTSIERQNVKLALQIFNTNVVIALRELGPKKRFEYFEDTAAYIELISQWWDIVNVKTLLKGKRHRNHFEEPITKNSDHIKFLKNFLNWLNRWKNCEGGGKLTKETHFALFQTTDALIKLATYCLDKKHWSFFFVWKNPNRSIGRTFWNVPTTSWSTISYISSSSF